MPFISELGEAVLRNGELTYEWKIRDFFSLSDKEDDHYRSPDFRFSDTLWYLALYPNGKAGQKLSGYVGLYLRRKGRGQRRTINYTFGLKSSDGLEEEEELKYEFSNEDSSWGYFECWSRSELRKKISSPPNNVFTITCRLKCEDANVAKDFLAVNMSEDTAAVSSTPAAATPKKKAKSAAKKPKAAPTHPKVSEMVVDAITVLKERGGSSLQAIKKHIGSHHKVDLDRLTPFIKKYLKSAVASGALIQTKVSRSRSVFEVSRNMGEILEGGKRSDFTLKLGDRDWPVHKVILESRCEYFANMFRHDWVENEVGEVKFDGMEEDTLNSVLRFVYTGDVEDMDVENVCSIYVAAHKFLLDDLKAICVEHMKEEMCKVIFCEVMVIADTYGEKDLNESAIEYFAREGGNIMDTEEWKKLKKNHSSIVADLLEEMFRREVKKRTK